MFADCEGEGDAEMGSTVKDFRRISIYTSRHGVGFGIELEPHGHGGGALYFSDWDDVQHAFANDLGLLRFLNTGEYQEADGNDK